MSTFCRNFQISILTILVISLVLFQMSRTALADDSIVTIVPAESQPVDEPMGEQPYEIVWAKRTPPRKALVDFDTLDGWTVECRDGAEARMYPSHEQRIWESKTVKLIYRGTDEKSNLILRPPKPIAIEQEYDCINLWIYGNNFGWVDDPKTPWVYVSALLLDADGNEHEIQIMQARWKEWSLAHRRISNDILRILKSGSQLSGIKITNCGNTEERELFFENLVFYQEELPPLTFEPRPKRGIDLFPGQDPGLNTGPGRLPFPTRPETILPENTQTRFKNSIERSGDDTFRFEYKGKDADLVYILHTSHNNLGWVETILNGAHVANGLVGAGIEFENSSAPSRMSSMEWDRDLVKLKWTNGVEAHLRIWQKSLVVDFFCPGGLAKRLSYGHITDVQDPELILLPYMNYRRHHLHVLAARGQEPCFMSIWMDWYLSNGSKPYAIDEIKPDGIYLNGGIDYFEKTDHTRNPVFERFFFTVSPVFEETLATIPNPPAKEGKIAGTRLWQESWGPSDYEQEMQRSRKLRAYGIEKLTQCNHEITWRDSGESFTFRLDSAPKRGGNEALKAYVAHQKSLGWRSGLYTNYCDLAPLNGMWDEDWVTRSSDGDWVSAWSRCYAPKPIRALEADLKLAKQIQEKFDSNAAYTDVHTSVAPWNRADYDARVPGAGTFASTFYAFGELLLNDQEVYKHHAWSEGNHQWLYAGLITGNYALTYSDLNLREYPYLPHFDLLKMHPLQVDFGIPWTARFFRGYDDWSKPENIENSIDQFIAATIAYGHIGWLVEEGFGMRQTCRSYYMLQQLQSRYVMQKPVEILYGTSDGLIDSSKAFLNGVWKDSKISIRYPEGLQVWVNGNTSDNWSIDTDGETTVLPPAGWLAIGDGFYESSALMSGKRVDRAVCPAYVYLDGRGNEAETMGIQTSGAVAVRSASASESGREDDGLSIIAVDGVQNLRISKPSFAKASKNDVRRAIAKVACADKIDCMAYDVEGKCLGAATVSQTQDSWTIQAVPNAIRYEISMP